MKNLFIGVSKLRIAKDLLFAVLTSLFNCGFTHIMSKTMDKYAEEDFLLFIFSVVVLLAMFALSLFIQAYHLTITECIIENGVYAYYVNKLYNIKPSVLKKSNTGYMAGLLNKVVGRQAEAYTGVVCSTPIDIAYIVYFAIILSKVDIRMSIVAITVCASGAILRSIMKTKMQPLGHVIADCEGARTKLFTDVVSNMETVQKMSVLPFMNTEAERINESCVKAWRKWAVLNEISGTLGKFITFGFGPVCLLIMYYMDRSYLVNNLSQVALIIAVSTQMPHNAKSFARTVSACYKFRDTASKLEEVTKDANIRSNVDNNKFQSASIINAQHKYIDKERDINIEVTIPEFCVLRGDKVCIRGESGQGKTTLLNLLSGCIESDSVYINGRSGDKRLDCVFVSQDIEIFDMSLRDNLCLGNPDITEQEMEELLSAVGLSEWFDAIGRDFETPLGERGVFVSTGQRQRLNLCRGLLVKDKEVYLLDEPTSNLDEVTERLMVGIIGKYLKDKTVVIVTHRPILRTICNCEYIFENGVLGNRIDIER